MEALRAARPPDLPARLVILLQDPDLELRRLARGALVTARVVEETDEARLLLLREKREEARLVLYRALKACPGYPEATWILVDVLVADGDYRAALQAIRGLAEPDLEARLRTVFLLDRLKEPEEAAALSSTLLEEYPEDCRVYLLAAENLLARDPPETRIALARAERAAELAPEEPATWAMLGRILGEFLDDPAAARDAWRRAVLLDSENEEFRRELKKYLGR
jgi:tetratricopeptide (TPR) repeat protein